MQTLAAVWTQTNIDPEAHSNSRYPQYAIWPRDGACHQGKPRMRSADSIPIVSTSVCFLPLKMYTGITKTLEFQYKTGMF